MKSAHALLRRALLAALALVIFGCSTTPSAPSGQGGGGPAASTSVEKVEYFPFQVKGYQGSYPHRAMIVLTPVEQREFKNEGNVDTAPMGSNPAIGDVFDNAGYVKTKLYADPLVPIVQQALVRAASE